MKAKIPIYDRETKKITIVEENDWIDYLWREGNYSCDCNRGIFCDLRNVPCGTERFVVPYVFVGDVALIDFDGDIEIEIIDACREVLK